MNARASFSGVQLSADNLYDEPMDKIENDRVDLEPNGNHNSLKLSVGFADSDDEQDQNEGMDLHRGGWFQGRRDEEFKNDFDVELSADRIRSMLQGEQFMFNAIEDEHFAEEVYAGKEPKIIHGYLFGDVIGEGSYAKVKEVVQETSLVRRAVKIIKHNRLRKIPNGAENVQREIGILRKVNHKNVVRLIEVFRNEEKKKLYMVLEFCMGSLQQLIDSSPLRHLPEPESHKYFCQLIEGLEYIHSAGIVHKDIKPGNLLLGTDFSLKISDFGVAEALSPYQADDKCSIVQGTPKFQAPELVSGNSKTFSGFKADVWSSGVTLYNMASGEYPFEGEAIMKLFDNIANLPLEMPVGIILDDQLKSLLYGMMEKNPDRRFDIDAIKHSCWFQKDFDKEEWAQTIERKRSAHRPLTVGGALEMMYAEQPPIGMICDEDVTNGDVTFAPDETVEPAVSAVTPPPVRRRGILGCILPARSP